MKPGNGRRVMFYPVGPGRNPLNQYSVGYSSIKNYTSQ